MTKPNTQSKQEQRARDKAAGLEIYHRERLKPEWTAKLDKLLNKLRKRVDI